MLLWKKAVDYAELDSNSALPFANYFCCQKFCFLNFKIMVVGYIKFLRKLTMLYSMILLGIRITNWMLALAGRHDDFDVNCHRELVLFRKNNIFRRIKKMLHRLARRKAWTSVWKDMQC